MSKYCSELMPLLLGYMSCLNQAKVGHVTKAFYALENFMENLGEAPMRSAARPRHMFSVWLKRSIMFGLILGEFQIVCI